MSGLGDAAKAIAAVFRAQAAIIIAVERGIAVPTIGIRFGRHNLSNDQLYAIFRQVEAAIARQGLIPTVHEEGQRDDAAGAG